jgi:hypothetical protein
VNKVGETNRNFDAFTNAMDTTNPKNDIINSLTEDPDSIVMVAYNDCKVKLIHSCKKFGSRCTNSIVKMACLIDHGARALPVIIGSDKITDSIDVHLPLDERI